MRFAWFHRLEEGLIALLLAVMTLVTFAQVVARYVFNYSFVWALELTMFLFAWLIFLGMSYGVRVGSHIGVDTLVKSLGPRAARVAGAAAAFLCLLYAVIVFYGSWQYVAKMYQIGILAEDLPIPQWVPRLALLIGYGLLIVRFAEAFYRIATGRETRMQVADEAVDALRHKDEYKS
ncbi:MAG: TRAP transporter small permease [Gemmatimonadota bacterium]